MNSPQWESGAELGQISSSFLYRRAHTIGSSQSVVTGSVTRHVQAKRKRLVPMPLTSKSATTETSTLDATNLK